MNAEALIGMVLGTCTLQKLIGQGGMGAVFLAQQSRPRRQVAVKVLLPMSPLAPNQQAAFLERFRRETDAAASLVHPNIMPVHEYGERDGLAYLVMPYISGGTLRDELEREGSMPLAKAVNYLEQMATALSVAHDCGVIHRDVKPANILETPEGRLVLSDFGLVKIVAEGQIPQNRLTGAGVPLGTPDYMAPEQVLGGSEVDARADIYSLGCILYHMITGVTPFSGDMPMQVAMQHLHTPPPPPSSLRPDLPPAAEQVILRVLAKQPTDRYMRAVDFASAFRAALTTAGVRLNDTPIDNGAADSRLFKPRSLFDPMWQKNAPASATNELGAGSAMPPVQPTANAESVMGQGGVRHDIVGQTSMTLPSFSGILPPLDAAVTPIPQDATGIQSPGGARFGQKKMSLLRTMDGFSAFAQQPSAPEQLEFSPAPVYEPAGVAELESTQLYTPPANIPNVAPAPSTFGEWKKRNSDPGIMGGSSPEAGFGGNAFAAASADFQPANANYMPPQNDPSKTRVLPDLNNGQNKPATTTGALTNAQGTAALMIPVTNEKNGQTTTMKLTQSVKVIKVPVAGQPGQYMTGLLPVLSQSLDSASAPPMREEVYDPSFKGKIKRNIMAIVLVSAAVILIFATSAFWIVGARSRMQNAQTVAGLSATDATATTIAQATTVAQSANIILADSLSANNHNWPVAAKGAQLYQFKDGAYHIANNDGNGHSAFALLPDETFSSPFVYSLTMLEAKGDDGTFDNQFGIVFHYNSPKKGHSTFYFFGVANAKDNGEYIFAKYDDGFGADVTPWSTLWHQKLGKEYHLGHGAKFTNTLKAAVNGKNFTLYMNGKKLASAQDTSFSNGQIGMLVNLKGTEIAFSNLMLTKN
jgi:eukaryotic-like serine/threonine-protein kinase